MGKADTTDVGRFVRMMTSQVVDSAKLQGSNDTNESQLNHTLSEHQRRDNRPNANLSQQRDLSVVVTPQAPVFAHLFRASS